MPMQASTDRDLARTGARQRHSGGRLLALGAVLSGIGLGLLLLFSADAVEHAGIVLAFLGLLPMMAGAGLMLSGLVSRRASRQKPFA